ncbi:MAG: photosystem I reaction center subunit IV [Proteobacteria bacterium]|nr:MAG: photosystem I reaction center subunit IV [Pseudomonadota bacterium]PIE40184.1 MAG: photosystem I reaction center subunit IV [Gammaproteobacteria bacterium]
MKKKLFRRVLSAVCRGSVWTIVHRLRFIAFSASVLVFFTHPATALEDVLETPAMETDLATQSLLLDITLAGTTYVAVGERGHIIYSEDGGKTWAQGVVPVSTTLTAVYFVDSRHGWAVGHGGIVLHTSDAGKTWIKQLDGHLANQMVIQAARLQVEKLEARLDAAPEEGKVDIEYELEEAQYNLEDAIADAETGASKPLLDVWFKDVNNGFAVGAYGFFFKTSDGGKTWENRAHQIKNPDRFHLNAIDKIAGDALFMVGEAGIAYVSMDFGETWQSLDVPYDGSFFGLTGTGNVNELLVFGLRGHVFRSVDLGQSWKRIDSGTDASLTGGSYGKNNNVTLVGLRGVVAVSNDSGESFISIERKDRQALSAVIQKTDQTLLLFGENGVVNSDSKGKNL